MNLVRRKDAKYWHDRQYSASFFRNKRFLSPAIATSDEPFVGSHPRALS